jgi:glycogen(starch) synthase
LRVLHLTTEYPPVIFGGLGTAVGGWVKASAQQELSVGVLLVEGPLVLEGDPPRYGAGGARATVVNTEGITFFQTGWPEAARAGVHVVERWQADVIHLHTAMLWDAAREIQQRTRKPLVYHVHSVDRAEYEIGQEPNLWLAHNQAQEAAIAAADRLVAISRSEQELLAYYYPGAADRVRVVGNGIEDLLLARTARRRQRPNDAPLILYSGRLVERKGIRELLAAVPHVISRAPDARFVLAGGPPGVRGAELAAQWLPTEALTFRDRIHFTGWLRPAELAEWYAAADVLVVPSRYEPFGMVVLEGMLYGLPIAASAVGGPAEILEDERTGLLFPPGDVAALAQQLARLATDRDLRTRLGQAAATQVCTRWAWPHLVTQMKDIYAEVTEAA